MNTRMIRYLLCKMLGIEAALLLIPALVGLIYKEKSGVWFVFVAAILFILFLVMGRRAPENKQIYTKEGMVIVSLVWILWSFFGALPGFLSGDIPNYMDAFFETISGFTTTGSTILKDIGSLPACMLFWRSFTHWIGGMGVLVFVILISAPDRSNSMYLLRAEIPGPEMDKLLPKARDTARMLYVIYLGLTLVLTIMLCLGGMNIYDSLIHAFSTAGTGGFSNYGASVAHFNSAYIEWVITIFMLLFGVNFHMLFLLILREFKTVFKNEELRVYIGITIAATIAVTINVSSYYDSLSEAIRESAFQVVSIITTTGFATADYTNWPMFSICIILLLMFIGSCASSTGGGVKVSRVIMMVKSVKNHLKELSHPKSVNIIKINGRKVSNDVLKGVYIFFLSYILILIGSFVIVSLDNKDFTTSFSAVLTNLNNVGPGIGEVDQTGSFADFSILSKIVLCIDMLAGRLEIFPFLMLFTIPAWKKKF